MGVSLQTQLHSPSGLCNRTRMSVRADEFKRTKRNYKHVVVINPLHKPNNNENRNN